MKPLLIPDMTSEECEALQAGLLSSQIFTVKRCQIVLASSRRLNATQIAQLVGCSMQNVRVVLRSFDARGADALRMRSR